MSMTCTPRIKREENTFSALHNCKCNVPSSARASPEVRLSMLVKILDIHNRVAFVKLLWGLRGSPSVQKESSVFTLSAKSFCMCHSSSSMLCRQIFGI